MNTPLRTGRSLSTYPHLLGDSNGLNYSSLNQEGEGIIQPRMMQAQSSLTVLNSNSNAGASLVFGTTSEQFNMLQNVEGITSPNWGVSHRYSHFQLDLTLRAVNLNDFKVIHQVILGGYSKSSSSGFSTFNYSTIHLMESPGTYTPYYNFGSGLIQLFTPSQIGSVP